MRIRTSSEVIGQQHTVTLLAHTLNPERLIYAAAKQCAMEKRVDTDYMRYVDADVPTEDVHDFLRGVLESGHESVLEHVTFTFAIHNVSRACTHQLVRHRIASFSQQSQRYVVPKDMQFVIPEAFMKENEVYDRFMESMRRAAQDYQWFLDRGFKAEDARYVLPNAASSSIVVTMNVRSLWNFFSERLCERAQWEIRSVAWSMRALCYQVSSLLFETALAKCFRLDYCPEKHSCGRFPRREDTEK